MPNSSSTWVSRSTTASLALERALWTEPGLRTLVGRQRVGDVAGQRELLDALRDRGVRRRLEVGLLLGVHRPAWARSARRRRRACSRLARRFLSSRSLEHRRVVGRVAHLGVDVVGGAAAAAADRLGERRRRRPRRRAVRPSSRSRQRGQPGGHLVDRRRGDDQRRRRAASSTSSGTTTYAERSRSSSRLETTKPIAPPPNWRSRGVAELRAAGCRWRCGRCRGRRSASASQPITCRPAGPLCSGSRMLRQPIRTSITGTSQPTLPTEPETTVRATSMTPPGSCHQTAAAATTARPIRNSPTPSRRCSGSRSRAAPPILRAPAPTPWAVAIQVAATPRPSAPKARETGPRPLRTARGADAGSCWTGLRLFVGYGGIGWSSTS